MAGVEGAGRARVGARDKGILFLGYGIDDGTRESQRTVREDGLGTPKNGHDEIIVEPDWS